MRLMSFDNDAQTIRAWARGDAVSTDSLVQELIEWTDYFALPDGDATAVYDIIDTANSEA